jgi:hypothetical protein
MLLVNVGVGPQLMGFIIQSNPIGFRIILGKYNRICLPLDHLALTILY